jgi:hypothetical protein
MMNREPIFNDWINHGSEECPIDENVEVEVIILSGDSATDLAKSFAWHTCGGGTIIKYRPVIDTNINHVTTTNLSEELEEMAETDPSGLSANTAGAKLDAGKVRPDLILSGMPRALLAVSDVGTLGANKYSENGWLSVPDGIKRYTAAMDRHRLKESIEPTDPDSELLHAAHLAWNALARLELMLRDK